MSWLSEFLHPKRAYQAGQNELDKYYQQAQQQYQPFIQQGQDAYGNLSSAMRDLMDPQALQDKWASGYKESEAAKQLEGMATEHGLDAASSLGLMGSSPALQAIQAGTSGIVANDRQQYLDNLMQKYLAGTGLAQGIYGTGANAASQAGQNAMTQGQNASQLAYGKNSAQGDLFSKLLGGGLGFLGGAVGPSIGAGFSQMMGWSPKGSYNPNPTWSTGGA